MKNPTRKNQEETFRQLYAQPTGSPMAVSSESQEHKRLRFSRIKGLFQADTACSIHDVGMGIADLNAYLLEAMPGSEFDYSGSEILAEYVDAARTRFPELQFFHRDIAEHVPEDRYDWVVMSGVFHQRRESSIRDWEAFSQRIIRNAFAMARKGIAFNFVSPFVDFYQTQVYYCNLPKLLNFINDDLSRFFQLRHDYALFEFTVYVYQSEYIAEQFPQSEFRKYF